MFGARRSPNENGTARAEPVDDDDEKLHPDFHRVSVLAHDHEYYNLIMPKKPVLPLVRPGMGISFLKYGCGVYGVVLHCLEDVAVVRDHEGDLLSLPYGSFELMGAKPDPRFVSKVPEGVRATVMTA